jgi:ABC-2 type transport system ATP-binding protein
MAVLSVARLCKDYGGVRAVDNVSFAVAPGEIVGLLGPNGAGKTTTINMVLGVLEPTSGTIEIDGLNVVTHRRKALMRTNFAAVYAPLPGNLTVEQNLRIFAMLYGVADVEPRIDRLIEQLDLKPFRTTRCGLLSSGEQTRVSLAKALLNSPHLLLLDEPTASLDPSTARTVRDQIRAFRSATTCGVLWTSHNMYEVADVCDRVLFLSRGRILVEGDPKALPQQYGEATLEDLFVSIAREPLSVARD